MQYHTVLIMTWWLCFFL